jgi:integrase/recombinase XerD
VTPPPILPDDDLRRLIVACRAKPNHGRAGEFERRRDTAMVLVLASTGIRAGELLGLGVDDVNFARETITVIGKGSKLRIVALLPQPADAVDRYLRVRRKHTHRHETALWLGEKGPLGYSGLRQMLERRCVDAGLDPINPHLLRHRFAHIARVKGMGDSELMSVAGWNSNQMLNRYGASAASERGRDAHRRLFSDERL